MQLFHALMQLFHTLIQLFLQGSGTYGLAETGFWDLEVLLLRLTGSWDLKKCKTVNRVKGLSNIFFFFCELWKKLILEVRLYHRAWWYTVCKTHGRKFIWSSRKIEWISKGIVTFISCHRPEVPIADWEGFCLSIVKDIVTIIGCSRPPAGIGGLRGGGARRSGCSQSQASSPPPPPLTPTSLFLNSGTLYISLVHEDQLHIKTACCHTYHRSGAASVYFIQLF